MKIKFSAKPGYNTFKKGDIVSNIPCLNDDIFKPNQMFTVTDFCKGGDNETYIYLDIKNNDSRLEVENANGSLNSVGWSTKHFKLIKSIS